MKHAIGVAKFVIGVVAAIMLCTIVINYYKAYKKAYNAEKTNTETVSGTDITISIPENSSPKEVAKILRKKGLIKYEGAFVDRLQESKYRGKIKAGTYTLNTGWNTLQMMEAMATMDEDNSAVLQTLVVPEGFSIDMIAARCEEQNICTAEEFKQAVNSVTTADFEYLADVPQGADVRYRLEGYLFPATYDIYKDTTATSLVNQMLDAFRQNYTAEMKARAEALNLNSFDVLNRASMIEREAKIDDERPKIASVINNRIKNDMPLQIDSTNLFYATNGMYDKSELTQSDLDAPSSYNTYLNSGLPAGPICNPGTACIQAVLYPEETNYLYYHISNAETGEHVFSETLEEHNETMEDDGE